MSARNKVLKICTVCFSEYEVRFDRADKSKWCSSACWKKRRILKDCEHCGGKITSYYGKRYCSLECSRADMVREKAPRWKDGKSLERERARQGRKLKNWRKEVFVRDDYTCQKCGSKGELHAHHIIEWAKDKRKRFDVENGVTLCIKCHGEVHGKDFTKRNKKKCPDCGKQIKRESKRCRRCATINQWKKQKSNCETAKGYE